MFVFGEIRKELKKKGSADVRTPDQSVCVCGKECVCVPTRGRTQFFCPRHMCVRPVKYRKACIIYAHDHESSIYIENRYLHAVMNKKATTPKFFS